MTEVIEEEEGGSVVSERVQVLAQGIYDEFQNMVESLGPDCIGNLAPLVVNVLENLDSALVDNQVHLTALLEVNEENEQLSKQYEREKLRRREIEEKAVRLEYLNEQEVKDMREQLSRSVLESKHLQATVSSQKELIDRTEERYEVIKKEKKDLHDRNIELIKSFHLQFEQVKENAAMKIAEARRAAEENAESPVTKRAPGFHDFTSPSKSSAKKRRHLPLAPRSKARAGSDIDEEFLLGTTPAQRPDSPEYSAKGDQGLFSPNLVSLHHEKTTQDSSEENSDEEHDVTVSSGQLMVEFPSNDDSLLAELHMATGGKSMPGVDDIIMENEALQDAKSQLTKEVDDILAKLRALEHERLAAESEALSLHTEKQHLLGKVGDLEGEVKRLRKELEDEKESTGVSESSAMVSPEGLRLSRLEVARVLRERNEYKEKYLSLLEQVRMNDELYLFKKKEKKSKWFDYFTALFSPSKRRQLEHDLADSTPRRPIFGAHAAPADDASAEDGGHLQLGAAGYRKTRVIPTLRRMGKGQDEVYMTSVSWVIPALDQQPTSSESSVAQANAPNINTCRPMSYQEDGAKILCASAVNSATFLGDCKHAVSIAKRGDASKALMKGKQEEYSRSLVWIVTGVPNLTKVNVLDAAAVGEVQETFIVSSSVIQCIAPIPTFNDQDPDVLASLSGARRKSAPRELQNALSDRPSSSLSTMWMGSDSGVLYVHSAVSNWKKCIHADKLPAAIQAIVHLKGKAFLLLQNSSLAVFRRFPDGEWDWDNYSIVVLSQRKDLPCSAIAAVKFNVWCSIGNVIHVVHSHLLKMEATFTVHPRKNAEVNGMVTVGDGVWISFQFDSTLRLFNSTTFTHMQDLDIAPSVHKMLVFGSEKRSQQMPIQVATMCAAHDALWVGTENGVTLAFPFSAPAAIAEESGWELIKEAEVGGQEIPEPFDVRTEHAVEAGALVMDGTPTHSLESSIDSRLSGASSTLAEAPALVPKLKTEAPETKPFNPFCNIDGVQLSIHCHINAVRSLLCAPGLVPRDLAVYKPIGGVLIGSGDKSQQKPALFVVSCGEGHLDLRTADKVLQTIHAKETGQSGLPTAASIISDKNYIMVWDING